MPGTRDHEALVIEDFQGWWQRGDPESAPVTILFRLIMFSTFSLVWKLGMD